MKISYDHLLNFLNDKPSIEDLSEKLFQLGHEHELEENIFNMELTPNRGDCLSLHGLARDLNFFYGNNSSIEMYEDQIDQLNLDFINLSPEDCPRISFLEIEVYDIPDKYEGCLASYFTDMNISKNNFFTDISNYLSYELGQPTHCYDKNKLNGRISFQSKECDSNFKTLIDTNVKLEGNNCIFLDNDEIINLAGVMGGMSTACSNKTKNVLIECAYFNPESIIGKSIKYNLQSDAAHKFERGVDINSHEKVLRRFLKIVDEHANIKSAKIAYFDSKTTSRKELPIDIDKINSILGTDISIDIFKKILIKLGFNINSNIEVPSYRSDISSQNDIAEEIARIIGYNNISNQSILMPQMKGNLIRDNEKITFIKNTLKNQGFFEVINFPFTSINKKHSILLDNPLDSSKNNLRIDLKESLIENLLYNERRQNDSIKLFELSDTYSRTDQIDQELKLGIIVSGRVGHNFASFSKKIDEGFLKQTLNSIFDDIDFKIEHIDRKTLNTKIKNKIFYIEINPSLHKLREEQESNLLNEIDFKKYVPISEFPSSNRDFSFLISDISKYSKVLELIENINDVNLKDFFIFDFYKNEENEEIKIGVRMTFQSTKCTLSDEDIRKSITKILKPILDIDGVSVPGL